MAKLARFGRIAAAKIWYWNLFLISSSKLWDIRMKRTILIILWSTAVSMCATPLEANFPPHRFMECAGSFFRINLKTFQGTLFSGQKFLSQKTAFRIGVSSEWFHDTPDFPSTTNVLSQEDSARANTNLLLQLLGYKGKSKLEFYWGGGLYAGFAYKFDQTQKTK